MQITISTFSKQYQRDFWGLRDFDLELTPGIIGFLINPILPEQIP